MSAHDEQVDGNHYRSMRIQPSTFIFANRIGFHEGNAIKYLVRWRDKNGISDLKKARHFIDLLIELEEQDVALRARQEHHELVDAFQQPVQIQDSFERLKNHSPGVAE